MQNIRLRKNDI